jgi:hypothetical protein
MIPSVEHVGNTQQPKNIMWTCEHGMKLQARGKHYKRHMGTEIGFIWISISKGDTVQEGIADQVTLFCKAYATPESWFLFRFIVVLAFRKAFPSWHVLQIVNHLYILAESPLHSLQWGWMTCHVDKCWQFQNTHSSQEWWERHFQQVHKLILQWIISWIFWSCCPTFGSH